MTIGIKTTAGVVTAAAVVMVFVFLTFATLSMIQLKEMGVGLAVAVLLDATVVRAVLLPATMKLLSPRNWYLPGWLGWPPQRDGTTFGLPEPDQRPSRSARPRTSSPRTPASRASGLRSGREPPLTDATRAAGLSPRRDSRTGRGRPRA